MLYVYFINQLVLLEALLSETFSHSRLGCFENCKHQYKLKYRDKIRVERDTIERFLGSMVHLTLEYTYKKANFEKVAPDKGQVVGLFGWYWRRKWNDNIIIVKRQYSKEHYRSIGEKAVARYFDQYAPFTQNKILGLEQKLNIKLDPDGLRVMTGVIDRIDEKPDGSVDIVDYKTGMNPPNQKQIDEERQLALYQIGVKELVGERKIRLVWNYLMSGIEFTSERSDAQLEALKKDTLLLIEEVESTTVFDKHPSALCNYCEYLNHDDGKGGVLCDGKL